MHRQVAGGGGKRLIRPAIDNTVFLYKETVGIGRTALQTRYIIGHRGISRGVDGSVAALAILLVLKTVGIHIVEHLVATVQHGGGGPHTGCILGRNAAEHRVSLVNIGGDVHHKHHTVRIEDDRKRRRLHLSFRFGGAIARVVPTGVEIVAVGDSA